MEITKLEYDCGDKRSYGSLEVEATTKYGVLKVTGMIASDSSLEDLKVTLDGKEVDTDFPDPGLPHYYAPAALRRRVDEKVQVREAIEEFLASYEADLENQGTPE